MWIATRQLRFAGTVYQSGEAVPVETSRNRHALAMVGSIRWVDDPVVDPDAAADAQTVTGIDLSTAKLTDLKAYATEIGVPDAAAYRAKADLIAAIEAFAAKTNDDDSSDTTSPDTNAEAQDE